MVMSGRVGGRRAVSGERQTAADELTHSGCHSPLLASQLKASKWKGFPKKPPELSCSQLLVASCRCCSRSRFVLV